MGKQGSQDLWSDLIKGDFIPWRLIIDSKMKRLSFFSGKVLIGLSMISLKFLKTCLEPLIAYEPYGL